MTDPIDKKTSSEHFEPVSSPHPNAPHAHNSTLKNAPESKHSNNKNQAGTNLGEDFKVYLKSFQSLTIKSFEQLRNGAITLFGKIDGPAIVPRSSIAGRTLLMVIAIMTFLACLTLGSVMLVNQSAQNWQSDIATEVTIQIRPSDQLDMQDALKRAEAMALETPGVTQARILDWEATKRMLEPWLGDGIEPDDLPIPRLIILQIDPQSRPDFSILSAELAKAIPNASLDDHNAWVERLQAMASATVVVGLVIFLLMLSATCLAAIFATQGALAGNRQVVEVLHFVGATDEFVAREFQRHFFRLGLRGTLLGGACALLSIAFVGWWTNNSTGTAQADQTAAFFGSFDLSLWGYLGIMSVAFGIALLTAITARFAVLTYLNKVYLAKSND